MQSSHRPSRSILEAAGEALGLFTHVPSCGPLMDIIGADHNSTSGLENFTEAPSEELLVDCISSALVVVDGTQLAQAIVQPLPAVKVVEVDNVGPTVWPAAATAGAVVPPVLSLLLAVRITGWTSGSGQTCYRPRTPLLCSCSVSWWRQMLTTYREVTFGASEDPSTCPCLLYTSDAADE